MQLQMETSRQHARARSVCKVYADVRRHIEDGYVRLRPPDVPGVDVATKFVDLQLDGEFAVISRIGWESDIARQYRISRAGSITRRLVDVSDTRSAIPSLSDWLWLRVPLALARLRYVSQALGDYYSPRRRRQSRIDSEAA